MSKLVIFPPIHEILFNFESVKYCSLFSKQNFYEGFTSHKTQPPFFVNSALQPIFDLLHMNVRLLLTHKVL